MYKYKPGSISDTYVHLSQHLAFVTDDCLNCHHLEMRYGISSVNGEYNYYYINAIVINISLPSLIVHVHSDY